MSKKDSRIQGCEGGELHQQLAGWIGLVCPHSSPSPWLAWIRPPQQGWQTQEPPTCFWYCWATPWHWYVRVMEEKENLCTHNLFSQVAWCWGSCWLCQAWWALSHDLHLWVLPRLLCPELGLFLPLYSYISYPYSLLERDCCQKSPEVCSIQQEYG